MPLHAAMGTLEGSSSLPTHSLTPTPTQLSPCPVLPCSAYTTPTRPASGSTPGIGSALTPAQPPGSYKPGGSTGRASRGAAPTVQDPVLEDAEYAAVCMVRYPTHSLFVRKCKCDGHTHSRTDMHTRSSHLHGHGWSCPTVCRASALCSSSWLFHVTMHSCAVSIVVSCDHAPV